MFTCIDIVITYIRNGSYEQVGHEERVYLHTSLLNWLCNLTPQMILEIPDYLKTKFSVIISLLIKMDYPQVWPDAFEVNFRVCLIKCSPC